MKTSPAKIIVLLVFVVTLGAGVVAGMLAARLPRVAPAIEPAAPGDSPLAEELQLSSSQREKMQKIWEGVRDLNQESLLRSQQADVQRDEAISKLIPPEKVGQYNDIRRNYAEAMAGLKGRRDAAFDKAVAESKEILTPDQQKKYDEVLARRLGSEGGAREYPVPTSAGIESATQPAL